MKNYECVIFLKPGTPAYEIVFVLPPRQSITSSMAGQRNVSLSVMCVLCVSVCLSVFLFVCLSVCLSVYLSDCLPLRLLITSSMMWCDMDPYDRLNKFFRLYMAAIVSIISRCVHSIDAHHINQPNKSKLGNYQCISCYFHFTSHLKQLYK